MGYSSTLYSKLRKDDAFNGYANNQRSSVYESNLEQALATRSSWLESKPFWAKMVLAVVFLQLK